MKILIVTLSNKGGGAARAVDSLAKVLYRAKHEVKVLSYEGQSEDYPIQILGLSKWTHFSFRIKNKIAGWFMGLFDNPSRDYRSINMFPSRVLLRAINESDADVVNFHWYGAEMLSIEQITQITKPIVWTMHDAWMVNGVYHVSPLDFMPYVNDSGDNWLNRFVFKRKQRVYAKVPMHFISPSKWIADRFYNGPFYKEGDTCTVIRNLIDTNIWKAKDKAEAKKVLGFKSDKTHVLFIANNILSSFNKGFVFVKQLLEKCDNSYEFHFVGNTDTMDLPYVTFHGRTTNTDELVLYYSASDVCIVPSLSESMSYVTIESLLCNTPVLCFDTTGPAEIIKTGVNGYKAKKFDVDDLLKGLNYLKDFHHEGFLRDSIPDFDLEINLNRYLMEYKKIQHCYTGSKSINF